MPKLGELLIKANLITAEQLEEALALQEETSGRIGQILVSKGFVKESDIVQFLSQQYGAPVIDFKIKDIDLSVVKLIPTEVAHRYFLVPIERQGNTLTIAMADPSNVFAMEDIRFMTGYNVKPGVARESLIAEAIESLYGSESALQKVMETMDENVLELVEDEQEEIDLAKLQQATEEAPVVKLVNLILTDAIKKGASDIHIEPYERALRVRYRVDGKLYETMNPPSRLRAALTSRIKILSELDIAERRLPQDGRIKLKLEKKKEVDLRVSILPTMYGEKIVLRILDKSNLMMDLLNLGFEPEPLKKFDEAIHKPYGIVLVTGPTGSGKTCTLYSALNKINVIDTNIMTAEDPVEFYMPGINQVQIHEAIGLNFANALRSFLRQDPDIVMVGEIRDFETAEIAIKAALTGHLVLSTLHTNDAPSTVNRLINMGIEPFLVASSTQLILAQRLVRKICKECKQPLEVPKKALIDIGFSEIEAKKITVYTGSGCSVCNNTGYKGRIALYEVMEITDELRELILRGASSLELKANARQAGMLTLRDTGLLKIKEGTTTIEEVLDKTVGN